MPPDPAHGGDIDAIWAVSDGAAGNMRQATALASAFGSCHTTLNLSLRAPWSWCAPRRLPAAKLALPRDLRNRLAPPWPRLAIGCGRQAAWFTRELRRASKHDTFCVQILDPRLDTREYDAVVAPRHDGLQGANVIQTIGSLNAIDDDWLARASREFPTLELLPQPRTALLIGGPRRDLGMDTQWFEGFLDHITSLTHGDAGSLMIACSRRTPQAWRQRLRRLRGDHCTHSWFGDADGINPYSGYLAAAERLVVTPDSVNMLSEACASGKPVFTLTPSGMRGKLVTFHAVLRERGWLYELDRVAGFSVPNPVLPLRELETVAAQIRQRMHAADRG